MQKERKKMKVKVTIEETISETFVIDVPEEEDAVEKGIEKYKKGELVLESGEVQGRQIMAESLDGSYSTNWVEF